MCVVGWVGRRKTNLTKKIKCEIKRKKLDLSLSLWWLACIRKPVAHKA